MVSEIDDTEGPAGAARSAAVAGCAAGVSASAQPLVDFARSLAEMPVAAADAARIDQIRALEDLKSACAAAQARVTAEFAASERALSMGAVPSAGDSPTGAADAERDAMRTAPSGPSPAARAAQIRAKAARLARRSAAAQVALARRESPSRGGRYVGLAEVLVHEMPCTLAALASGVINEARAVIIAAETACLSRAGRAVVDAEIAGRLDGLGNARLSALVRSIAYRLEPRAATERAQRAAGERRVSIRPAPDTMAYLTLLLPLPAAVSCYGSLRAAADAHPGGDGRSPAQRMADTAVARLTGAGASADGPPSESSGAASHAVSRTASGGSEAAAEGGEVGPEAGGRSDDPVEAVRAAYAACLAGAESGSPNTPAGARTLPPLPEPLAVPRPSGPPRAAQAFPPGTDVVVNLVISDHALLAGGDEPAYLPGNLPLPAPLARRMLADLSRSARVWIRRLYTRPDTGTLVAMDSRRRKFPPGMRDQLLLRDQDTCRTPWCNAPARHADHIRPHAAGGRTSIGNGQSLSEDCNYIRTAAGWSAEPGDAGAIGVTTPTGHRYLSPAPVLIAGGPVPTPIEMSFAEFALEVVLAA